MKRADEIVQSNMITIMILYGVIIQVVCLFVTGDCLKMAAGLWIGIATGIGMLIHMRNSLLEALVMDEDGAKRYMQKTYVMRYFTVVIVFAAVLYFKIANIVTLILGVMGLKFSAYLQPIMQKLLKNLK